MANAALPASIALALPAGIHFAEEFLSTAIFAPRLNPTLRFLKFLNLGLLVCIPFLVYYYVIIAVVAIVVPTMLTVVTVAVVILLQKFRPARLFIVANAGILAGAAAYAGGKSRGAKRSTGPSPEGRPS